MDGIEQLVELKASKLKLNLNFIIFNLFSFRKQLKETVHLSGMRDKYLFPVMKQLNTQLNLSDYTELERKYRCEITIGSNMVFIKAMRGSKLDF
jgi:hypothetical protein